MGAWFCKRLGWISAVVAFSACNNPIRTVAACQAADQPLTVTHNFDLAQHMPAHLSMMFSMSWFGIPASDPQKPGPDDGWGNYEWSGGNPDAGCLIKLNDTASCSENVTPGEEARVTASKRRMMAGIYSVSGRDQDSLNRTDLMLSTLHRPCSDGAGLDAWSVQVDGLRDTSLHPANKLSVNSDLAYRAMVTFLNEADKNGLGNVMIGGDDTTWYFHFGKDEGLGKCDDTDPPNNPKQNCIDALTQDFVDLVTVLSPHPSAYRIDGKLVLFIYVDNQYLTTSQWTTILANARNAAGQDFYVIASGEDPAFFDTFDAIAPWVNLGHWKTISGDSLYNDAYAWVDSEHSSLLSGMPADAGRVVFGGAAPGFDDYTEDWGTCTERELPPAPYAPRDPNLLDAEFDYFKAKGIKGVILQTWDDWTEGTNIEPDMVGGTSVLTHVREGLREVYGEASDPAGDTALNDTWVKYGQPYNCCFAGGACPAAGVTPTLTCPAGSSSSSGGSSSGGTTSGGSSSSGSSSGGSTGGGSSGSGSSGSSGGGGGCEWTLKQISNDPVGSWAPSNVVLPMDVNGDKKTDLVVVWDNGGEATAQVSPSNGTDFVQSSNDGVGGWNASNVYLPMDVNGDGKADLVVVWNNGGTQTAQVSLSSGTAFSQVSNGALGGYAASSIDLAMDVNGDHKTDLVILWDDGSGQASAEVNLSNGSAFGQASNAAVGAWNTAGFNLVGDVNGDGKTDLVRILPSGTNAVAEVWLANAAGTGFSEASADVVGGWNGSGDRYQLADVNGDGKADLVILWPNGANTSAQVSISNGTSFAQVSNDSLGATVAGTQTLFEDVNGDGKVDLVQVYPSGTTTEAQVWISDGASFASNSTSAQGGWTSSWIDLPMDVGGAGQGALVVLWQDTSEPAAEETRAQISVPVCG